MFIQTLSIAATTAADGTATAYSDVVQGQVEMVKVVLGGWDTGAVDLVLTDEKTGAPIVTITNATDGLVVRPRGATHDVSGAAALYAAAGQPVNEKIAVNGRIKMVVAQGGNAKAGSVWVMLS